MSGSLKVLGWTSLIASVAALVIIIIFKLADGPYCDTSLKTLIEHGEECKYQLEISYLLNLMIFLMVLLMIASIIFIIGTLRDDRRLYMPFIFTWSLLLYILFIIIMVVFIKATDRTVWGFVGFIIITVILVHLYKLVWIVEENETQMLPK